MGAAVLAIPGIPSRYARTGHIIPGFTNNLISLGKLCDADCTAYIDKNKLEVHNKDGHKILHGTREPTGPRLWRVDITATANPPQTLESVTPPTTPDTLRLETLATTITPPTTPKPPCTATKLHVQTLDLPNTPALVAYLHATAGYPVKQTWLEAIKRGAYDSWPGLTYKLAARHCPSSDETLFGHMAQPRQHIRSTRVAPATPRIDTTMANASDMLTTQDDPSITLHEIPINYIFTDDTGRFTPRARSGNQYVMVALHSESNAILVQPFQTKADGHRIAAYTSLFERLKGRHATPDTHVLDNEASRAFLQAITNNGCRYQLVPPHVHRRNRAERAIRTFKDHFLAILAGAAPTFPRDRWDLLLPQAELTLNLLRPSPQPTMSAWHHLFGPYNFDATPMGPAGCRVLIHSKASIRRSWENRCHEGFYIGPSLVHYRCYRVLNKHSGAVTISDAVKFRHHYLPTPELSAADKLLHAVQAIHNTIARASPADNHDQLAAIEALRAIIHSYNTTTVTPPTEPQLSPLVAPPPPGVVTRPDAAPPGVATRLTASPPGVAARNPTPPHPNDRWTTIPMRPGRRCTAANDEPIAQRTRARTTHNAFAVLADEEDDTSEREYHTETPQPRHPSDSAPHPRTGTLQKGRTRSKSAHPNPFRGSGPRHSNRPTT